MATRERLRTRRRGLDSYDVLALGRLAGGVRAASVSWINMAIGIWLFSSAFWLASSSQASWNVGILGVIVFVLGAWASAPTGRVRAA